jgi:chemotaxis protein histidine kinase CheA
MHMKTTQKISAVVLAMLLAATIYGLIRTAQRAAPSDAQKNGTTQATQVELVDQSSLRNAQRLTQVADKPDEQAFAAEAVRLADHDMDVAFDIAKREVKAHPQQLSAKAQEIQARLEKAESTQKSEQAEVARLTAEEAKATGSRKAALDDQLDTAKGVLESTDNEVDDASQDLIGEGGDAKWRLEQLEQQHKSASESVDNAAKVNVAQLPEQFGLIHRYQQWDALQQKRKLLVQARDEAQEAAAKMAAAHDALKASLEAAKLASPELAKHARKSAATAAPAAASTQKARSHEESQAAVARVKEIVSEQMNLSAFDKRRDYQTDLAANYAQWIAAVEARQAGVLHRALQGIVIILVIGVVGVFFGSWMDTLVSRLTMDRRQVQSLHTVTRVSLQILGLLLILIVILGPPSQLVDKPY